jgi:diguanylate cyclase (GGDEF)-like protein
LKAKSHRSSGGKAVLAHLVGATMMPQRLKDLQRDMTELNVLHAFASAVSERLDREKILQAVSEHLPRLFDYDVLALLLDSSHPEIFVFGAGQAAPSVVQQATRGLLDTHELLSGRHIHEKDVKIRGDVSKREPAKAREPLRSQLSMPLVSCGENLGGIGMVSHRAAAFGPVDVQLFSLIAYQLGAAFRNALLLKETWERAVRDGLTGLFNRRHFSERLEEEFRRSSRYKHSMSLVLLDVDHFKNVNDTFGHSVGDRVLQAVARAMEQGSRKTDVVCRYGGEEFALILPETALDEALILAERLRKLVPALSQKVPGLDGHVEISLGVSSTWGCEGALKVEELLDRADGSLYQAKRQGRNRVCFYSPIDGRVQSIQGKVEMRRRPRHVAQLPVRYTMVPDLGPQALRGRSADVSADGVRMIVAKPVATGTFMVLDLGKPNEPMRVLIKIVWCRPAEEEGRHALGAQIVSFADGAEPRFRQMLTTLGLKNLARPITEP